MTLLQNKKAEMGVTAATAVVELRSRGTAKRPFPTKPVIGIGSVLLLATLWQLAATVGWIPVAFTSSPLAVLAAGVDLTLSGELAANALPTFILFAAGFVLAAVVGVPLGMLMGWKLRFRQTFEPLLTALYVTPSIVLLPIFVLVLGIGSASKIAIIFLEVVITVVINTMAGIRETNPKLVQAARSFQASDWDVFRKVLFPSALPTIVAGLRLGVGRGIITVIVAELYGGQDGIGVLISLYGSSFKTAPLLFLVLFVGVFGYVASSLLRRAETLATPWKK